MTEPTPPQLPTDNPGESADVALFSFTEERKFQLYVEQRRRYSDGARDAYTRFHQAIIGLSAGSIVLSITFIKDIGHDPTSIPWLMASWGLVILGSLCAFFALITSGESDRERILQLDCLAKNSSCDERRAERFGRTTVYLNYCASTLCLLGIVCLVVFASINIQQLRRTKWHEVPETDRGATLSAPRETSPVNPQNRQQKSLASIPRRPTPVTPSQQR